jgi:hypothetical protein
VVLSDVKPSDCTRRGSAGVVGSMMLLKSNQRMHAPFTQVSLDNFGLLDNLIIIIIICTFLRKFKEYNSSPFSGNHCRMHHS